MQCWKGGKTAGAGAKGRPVFLGGKILRFFFFLGGGWIFFLGLNGFFVDICLGDLVVVQR